LEIQTRILGIRVRVEVRQEDVSSVDRQGADVRSPQELFVCITGGDDRICVVSSDETRYSSVVPEQSRVERLDLCQLQLTVTRSLFVLLRSMFAVT